MPAVLRKSHGLGAHTDAEWPGGGPSQLSAPGPHFSPCFMTLGWTLWRFSFAGCLEVGFVRRQDRCPGRAQEAMGKDGDSSQWAASWCSSHCWGYGASSGHLGGPVSRLPARSGRSLRPPQMARPCAAPPSSTSRLPRPSRQKLPSGASINLESSLNPCRC